VRVGDGAPQAPHEAAALLETRPRGRCTGGGRRRAVRVPNHAQSPTRPLSAHAHVVAVPGQEEIRFAGAALRDRTVRETPQQFRRRGVDQFFQASAVERGRALQERQEPAAARLQNDTVGAQERHQIRQCIEQGGVCHFDAGLAALRSKSTVSSGFHALRWTDR
jgi:hypothetical protein